MQVTNQRIERWGELIYTEHHMELFYSYNDVFIKQFHRWSGVDLTRSVRRCILVKARTIIHGSPQITRGRLLRSHADGAGMATSGLCGWLLGDACCAVLDGFEAWVATAALVLGGEEIPSITLVSTGRAQDGNTLVCVCVFGSHGIGDALSRMIQVPREFQQQKTTPLVFAAYICVRMLFVIWQRTHIHRRHVDRFGRMQPGPQCESRLEKTFIAGS